jgi:hypothetical protein
LTAAAATAESLVVGRGIALVACPSPISPERVARFARSVPSNTKQRRILGAKRCEPSSDIAINPVQRNEHPKGGRVIRTLDEELPGIAVRQAHQWCDLNIADDRRFADGHYVKLIAALADDIGADPFVALLIEHGAEKVLQLSTLVVRCCSSTNTGIAPGAACQQPLPSAE